MIYPSTSSDRLVFRPLRADEIEVRPCDTAYGRVKLLLYKKSRVDQIVLDETVGALNWQKEYYEERGLLFCKIGIKHPTTGEWIWKADTGSESNIEAEKGLATDTAKRAASAWGIGRELYTAPRISITLEEKDQYNGKLSQTFKVGDLQTEKGVITRLTIVDKWNNVRFSFPGADNADQEETVPLPSTTNSIHVESTADNSDNEADLRDFCERKKKVATMKEKRELERFQAYYMGPNKYNPNQSIIKQWKNLDLERLWDNWVAKSY